MIAAGEDWDDPSEYNYNYENKLLYPMGSLAVMPGCTLFMYGNSEFTGYEYENHIKISDIYQFPFSEQLFRDPTSTMTTSGATELMMTP